MIEAKIGETRKVKFSLQISVPFDLERPDFVRWHVGRGVFIGDQLHPS